MREKEEIACAAGATCGGAKESASLLSLPAGDAPPARGALLLLSSLLVSLVYAIAFAIGWILAGS